MQKTLSVLFFFLHHHH